MRLASMGILLFIVPILGICNTIHVPGDYPTIQSAIDASITGDFVLVEPGSYFENIDFKGKLVKVLSEEGPESTVIDGSQAGSVVTFASKEYTGALLSGFTICNGSGTQVASGEYEGGGIYCMGSKPTIENNIITLNSVSGPDSRGGGINCNSHATPLIRNNIVALNSATGDPGLAGCGGGIYCSYDSIPLITGNRILHNTVDGLGGGIFMRDGSSAVLSSNVISDNVAGVGGGLWTGGDPVVGGTLTSCNNTITNNSAGSGVGGWYISGHCNWEIINTIVWNNTGSVSSCEINFDAETYSTLKIDFSDVKGGEAGIFVGSGCNLYWSATNIDDDPLFVDETHGDYHIQYSSPCRHSGSNGAPYLPTSDFEGDPRIAYTRADMGADEFYTHLYVTGDATPGGSVEGKLVGLPGTTPVGLFFGSGVLSAPINTKWGDFLLQGPLLLIPLVPVPATGVLALPATLPVSLPAPYDLPMQALIGLDPDSLTNLFVLNVR